MSNALLPNCKYCGKFVNPSNENIISEPIYTHLGLDDVIHYHKSCKPKSINMIHIHTKQVKKCWYCYGTIQGYDYSFKGGSMEFVQSQMIKLLQDKNIAPQDVEWHEVEIYDNPNEQKVKPEIGYTTWRIDKGMV